MTVSVKTFWAFVLISFYTILYSLWVITIDITTVNDYAKLLFPWVSAAIVIQLFCFLRIKKVKMFDIGLWFLVLSYLCMGICSLIALS